jgi:hypothetical protein
MFPGLNMQELAKAGELIQTAGKAIQDLQVLAAENADNMALVISILSSIDESIKSIDMRLKIIESRSMSPLDIPEDTMILESNNPLMGSDENADD